MTVILINNIELTHLPTIFSAVGASVSPHWFSRHRRSVTKCGFKIFATRAAQTVIATRGRTQKGYGTIGTHK